MAVSRISHWACPQLDLALGWRLRSGTKTKPAPRAGLTLTVPRPLPFPAEAPPGGGETEPFLPTHIPRAAASLRPLPATYIAALHPCEEQPDLHSSSKVSGRILWISLLSSLETGVSVHGTSKVPPSTQQAEKTHTQGAGPAGFAYLHPLFFLGQPIGRGLPRPLWLAKSTGHGTFAPRQAQTLQVAPPLHLGGTASLRRPLHHLIPEHFHHPGNAPHPVSNHPFFLLPPLESWTPALEIPGCPPWRYSVSMHLPPLYVSYQRSHIIRGLSCASFTQHDVSGSSVWQVWQDHTPFMDDGTALWLDHVWMPILQGGLLPSFGCRE